MAGYDDERHGATVLLMISESHIIKLISLVLASLADLIGTNAMGTEPLKDPGTFMKNLTDEGQFLDST